MASFDDDEFDDWDGDPDGHGFGCDCEDCQEEDAWDECSYMPEHGGCLAAGSEWCDWECPMRQMLNKEESEQ